MWSPIFRSCSKFSLTVGRKNYLTSARFFSSEPFDRTTFPSGTELKTPGSGGIDSPAVPPAKPSTLPGSAERPLPQAGDASLPPFEPSDSEEQKKRRVATWNTEPSPKPEGGHEKCIPLQEEGAAAGLLRRFSGGVCPPPPNDARKTAALQLINAGKFPVITPLVKGYAEGMEGALKLLAKSLSDFSTYELQSTVDTELVDKLAEAIKELNAADAKIVWDIQKVESARLVETELIIHGVNHDVLANGPFKPRMTSETEGAEFHGCLEVLQSLCIRDASSNEILFGKEEPSTAHYVMRFSTSVNAMPFPPWNFSRSDWASFLEKAKGSDPKEFMKNKGPLIANSWTLMDINDLRK